MSQPNRQANAPETGASAATGRFSPQRVIALFGRLRAWSSGHWTRSAAIAATILILIATTMAGWAYLASIALRHGQISLAPALAALDERNYDEARALVGRMLKSGKLAKNEYGGPLYVLGAVKMHDAENQATPERRRIEYLVASRYLAEARTYGFPPERESDGMLLLGKSLVESAQFQEGIEALDELLASNLPNDHPVTWEANRLLANTCLLMPYPDVAKALQHNEVLLSRTDLNGPQRAAVLMQRAECLARLERFEEARTVLAGLPGAANRAPEVLVMLGRIELDEVTAVLQRIASQDRSSTLKDSSDKVTHAMQLLEQARALDDQKGQVTRQSTYHLARAIDLLGNTDEAVKQFSRLRQLDSDTFEGLAAWLAEADARRRRGDFEGALLAYRRVLESYTGPGTYRSVMLPLPELRERIMFGLKDFLDKERFADALTLLEYFPPLFSRTEQLEVRGDTLERWGNLLLGKATSTDAQAAADRAAGRRHLRAAGVAFERLAELRFGSRFYTGDLWHSAEDYFRGHSFSRTVRLLEAYLENEPELRNAQALLRLGQAHLALGQIPQSVGAFEECIEFHPLDSSTYQARIDCAKAYWGQGNTARAERLLRDNIAGTTLRPSSREWRDSLFELGMLLHEMGRYDESIGTLEEAIERYQKDPQCLLAQYVIGDSYRRWAQDLLERVQQARTESERGKTLEQARERLMTALSHFEAVQVSITLKTHDIHSDPLMGTMLRNCYMLQGTVLFELATYGNSPERYKEAIVAFSKVSSLYPDDPFALETFVQIANCWRRLGLNDKARGSIQQAQMALDRLPPDADFAGSTALNREEWRMLLADMSKW